MAKKPEDMALDDDTRATIRELRAAMKEAIRALRDNDRKRAAGVLEDALGWTQAQRFLSGLGR
jgi:hypothetical protein